MITFRITLWHGFGRRFVSIVCARQLLSLPMFWTCWKIYYIYRIGSLHIRPFPPPPLQFHSTYNSDTSFRTLFSHQHQFFHYLYYYFIIICLHAFTIFCPSRVAISFMFRYLYVCVCFWNPMQKINKCWGKKTFGHENR